MAIDLSSESLMTLNRATRHRLFKRDGKNLNFSTVWRWGLCGCRGVKLETVRVGRTLMTSDEAIRRFIERMSTGAVGNDSPTPSMVARAHRLAEQELDAAGI
jgi:hypothetical protein